VNLWWRAHQQVQGVDWAAWFLQEGMPPVAPAYDLSLVQPVQAYAALVVAGGGSAAEQASYDLEAWPSLQQQLFLQELLDQAEQVRGGWRVNWRIPEPRSRDVFLFVGH
jgi:hypothetical protein